MKRQKDFTYTSIANDEGISDSGKFELERKKTKMKALVKKKKIVHVLEFQIN